jgi:hypothetical protein
MDSGLRQNDGMVFDLLNAFPRKDTSSRLFDGDVERGCPVEEGAG